MEFTGEGQLRAGATPKGAPEHPRPWNRIADRLLNDVHSQNTDRFPPPPATAMSSADRRARERQEVRDKILDAARDLFATQGFEAVTLRKVAEAIEYAPAAIYGHFKDKEELVRTLCLADFDELVRNIIPLAEIGDPIERIRRLGHAYVRFAITHPNHYRLMFMYRAQLEPDEDALARKDDPHRDGYAFVRHAATQAIAEGRIREPWCDAELLAQTFWAGVHGVASIEIAFKGDPWIEWRSIEARTESMIGALLAGLCEPGGGPKARKKPMARRGAVKARSATSKGARR